MGTGYYSTIMLDILGVIVLLFLAYLVSNNTVLTKKNTKNFVVIVILITVIIIAEIFSVTFTNDNSTDRGIRCFANGIGFVLSPWITLQLAFLYEVKLKKWIMLYRIPIIVNGILSICSIFTGWIFTIDSHNHYERGTFFPIYVLCGIYAFGVFVYANIQQFSQYKKSEKMYLFTLYTLVVVANAVQILIPQLLVIWGCTAIALLLYYVFLRELQFKYDPLTKMLNREAFEREMEVISELSVAAVFVFDLNSLKHINDQHGHRAGDEYIILSANMIATCFQDVGRTYRIGGDEFCVLSRGAEVTKIQNALSSLRKETKKREFMWNHHFYVSYGHSFYRKGKMRNSYDAFGKADKKMYKHKEKSKMKTRY